jgi:hypothetical protein
MRRTTHGSSNIAERVYGKNNVHLEKYGGAVEVAQIGV